MRLTLSILLAILLIAAGCNETAATRSGSGTIRSSLDLSGLKPQAENIVRRQISDPSAYLRSHAIEVAVETGQRQLMPKILEQLKDTSVAVRFAAAVAVGDLKCIPCEGQLIEVINDPNPNVQIAAAYSLIQVGNAKYKSLLYQAVSSSDETLRANAILLIGKLKDPKDLDLLYGVLRDDRSSEKIRFQAVESIARLGDVRVYKDKLWPMLISKYADDRVMGIRGMGILGTYEARMAVQTMLQDDVLEVRLTAAEQLGRMKDSSGQDVIAGYFRTNPDLNQQTMGNQMAVLAIGRIGGPELESQLHRALNSSSKLIQLAGAQSVLLLTR